MILTQEIIETHNGRTIYQLENGEPISAVFIDEYGAKKSAKNKDQVLEWWETDGWYRSRKNNGR